MNASDVSNGRIFHGHRSVASLALCAWAATALPCAQTHGETIELVDGTRIETDHVRFLDGAVIIADGRVIQRGEIKRILFDRGTAAQTAESEVGTVEVEELLRIAALAEKEHPDAGAIMLIDDGETVIREDGTQFERFHNAIKILKEDWKSIAEISQEFEEGRDRVTLVRARSIAPDGTVEDFDPVDLQESKPVEEMDSFTQDKVLSGHLAGVAIGSIVEIIWDRETYNPASSAEFVGENRLG